MSKPNWNKKSSSIEKGMEVKPFDSVSNPYNFEGHLTVDWQKQIEEEASSIVFKQIRTINAQERRDNPLLPADALVDVKMSLWECTKVEAYTKPGLIQVNFQPSVASGTGGINLRSGGSSSVDNGSIALAGSSNEYRIFEDRKRNFNIQEERKDEAIKVFTELLKKTMLPATFVAWNKRFIESNPVNTHSVFSIWESVKMIREPKLLEVIDQKIRAFHRHENHLITMEAWVDNEKSKFREFYSLTEHEIEQSVVLRRMQLMSIWKEIRQPFTHIFSSDVNRGIEEFLKKDSYAAISKEVSVENLQTALNLLVQTVQRISTESLSMNPIVVSGTQPVNHKDTSKGVLRNVTFGEDEGIRLSDGVTSTKLLKEFSDHFANATGEAKAIAYNALRKGKAEKGASDLSKNMRRGITELGKQQSSNNKEAVVSTQPGNNISGGGRYGGRGRGGRDTSRGPSRGGRGDTARGGRDLNRGGRSGNFKPNAQADYQEETDEIDTSEVTCVTVCKAMKPCGNVTCDECLKRALSDKAKAAVINEDEEPSKKRNRWNKLVTWTPVLGALNRVNHQDIHVKKSEVDPEKEFHLLLDSGSEQTAVREKDIDHLDDVKFFDARNKPHFVATSASGHTLPILGKASISPALRDCYVMGNELVDNLLSCDEFSEDSFITLVPRSLGLDWRAYIYTVDGRVIAVADERLRVYPAFNDAMIVGIPNIIPPVISNRDEEEFGPSGEAFWKTAGLQCKSLKRVVQGTSSFTANKRPTQFRAEAHCWQDDNI
jgi:hypothetical protein